VRATNQDYVLGIHPLFVELWLSAGYSAKPHRTFNATISRLVIGFPNRSDIAARARAYSRWDLCIRLARSSDVLNPSAIAPLGSRTCSTGNHHGVTGRPGTSGLSVNL
jgi:hypothetical protein